MKKIDKKKQQLEKIVLESNYPFSPLVYNLIHQDCFKNTINKIDGIGVPCNVNPSEIISAEEQFIRLLDRFIEYFDNTFYFLHNDSYLYIRRIIETNYKKVEKYLLSKHYLGDNDYIDFFNDSIYRIIITNFVKNISFIPNLKKLFIKEKIEIKNINQYTLEEVLNIKDLLSDIVLSNAKDTFNSILLFEDIDDSISKIIKNMKKKAPEYELNERRNSMTNLSILKIDILIEEYLKKKKYLIYLK